MKNHNNFGFDFLSFIIFVIAVAFCLYFSFYVGTLQNYYPEPELPQQPTEIKLSILNLAAN
jgi:hypothetical protein